jgi:acetyl esterase/lipase
MKYAMMLVLAAALLIQTSWGASENVFDLTAQCEEAVPLHYGEDPSQTFGIKYYPDGPPRPVLIYIHSGGWASGPITSVPKDIPEPFHKLGMAFAVIGHRTVKEFPHPAQVEDVQSGVRYIKDNAKKWNIDPDRIVISGRSSGGHLTMWAGVHPDSPKVAAIMPRSAPSDFHPEFTKTFADQMPLEQYYKMLFGDDVVNDPGKMARVYDYWSPMTYFDKDDPPAIFLHNYTPPPGPDAKSNWAVHHHAFGVQAHKQLKEAGGTAELFIAFDKGGSEPAEEAFLRKYIFGEKDIVMPPTGLEKLKSMETQTDKTSRTARSAR